MKSKKNANSGVEMLIRRRSRFIARNNQAATGRSGQADDLKNQSLKI